MKLQDEVSITRPNLCRSCPFYQRDYFENEYCFGGYYFDRSYKNRIDDPGPESILQMGGTSEDCCFISKE
jgi:hypothetical protein